MGFLGCLILVGCASQQAQVGQSDYRYTPQADGPALALACDPPATIGQPALYLDREPREPAAFTGYAQPTVTYSDTRVDDFYQPAGPGGYTREAQSEQIGVSTR